MIDNLTATTIIAPDAIPPTTSGRIPGAAKQFFNNGIPGILEIFSVGKWNSRVWSVRLFAADMLPRYVCCTVGVVRCFVGSLSDRSRLYLLPLDFDLCHLRLTDQPVIWRCVHNSRTGTIRARRDAIAASRHCSL